MKTLKKLYKGKSQKQLAKEIGVSQPTVCDWVNGHAIPSPKYCKKIAELGGVPFQQVITEFYQ
jgi:transcriptional regulator with XRE-family HTH domain